MSFFKALKNRMVSPKASIVLKLNKNSFVLGESIEGSFVISSQEDFQTKELRCELQCIEELRRTKRVYDENLRIYVDRQVNESATLFAAKPNIAGSMKIDQGYAGTFPLNINIPAGARATYKGIDNKVTWSIKGVAAVDGRPDVTSSVNEIQVIQPNATTTQGQAIGMTPIVKEVVKEVVMIPCRYCGGLMPQTQTTCPNCGAKRTL